MVRHDGVGNSTVLEEITHERMDGRVGRRVGVQTPVAGLDHP